MLDSGSTGLYVLADAVQGQTFEQTGRQMHTGYSNGQRLQGDIAIADLSFADGSVQFLREDIDALVYKALVTRAGGEVVTESL